MHPEALTCASTPKSPLPAFLVDQQFALVRVLFCDVSRPVRGLRKVVASEAKQP